MLIDSLLEGDFIAQSESDFLHLGLEAFNFEGESFDFSTQSIILVYKNSYHFFKF